MELYRKVYIKSEADLPKEEGEYIVSHNYDKAVEFFCSDNPYDISHWLEDIDWYLQPFELDMPTDEEIERECPAYTKLSGECDAWIAGAKFMREEIKKRNK